MTFLDEELANSLQLSFYAQRWLFTTLAALPLRKKWPRLGSSAHEIGAAKAVHRRRLLFDGKYAPVVSVGEGADSAQSHWHFFDTDKFERGTHRHWVRAAVLLITFLSTGDE
jgi:hypothetical protein